MSAFRPVSLFLLCTTLLESRVPAQTAPSASSSTSPAAHSHTPAPSAHNHGAVMLEQFVTSASPFPRNQVDLAQSTHVLGGQALVVKQQATLGDTLSSELGMSATSFGPGASRPIIRGLGGDRIRLLENSVGTIDASVTSPDHAVSVEPFLIDRIEIIRGPASLLYGSNAVGGVVNVITHRIETDLPTEMVRGTFELRGGSAAHEFARGGVIDVSTTPKTGRAFVLHLDGFRRSTDDVRIPGFAESARIRAEETDQAFDHGEPVPDFARDRLPNSALESESAAAGLSFVSEHLHLGGSYSGFNTTYGVPGHAHDDEGGIRIELQQRRTDLQGEWHADAGLIRGARLKFGHARYRHAEIEADGSVGTIFRNRGYDARLELLHGDAKPWSGAIGVQSTRTDFNASGAEAFLPPSDTRSHAVFAFEEFMPGSVAWQFGGRLEQTRIAAESGPTRRFDEASGSLGAVWKLDDAHALAVSLTHTGRAPNAQELFAYGPHAGTQAFEIGDAALKPERSLAIEASVRRRAGRVTGSLTLFANRFRGYIFEQPTGLIAREDGRTWEFLPPGDAANSAHSALPVYRYMQRDARFWGAELEAVWHLHEKDRWQLDLRLATDFTRGREGARNLPRIPARRVTTGVFWSRNEWTASAESQWVFDQDDVATNETVSEGYTLISGHLSRAFAVGQTRCEVFVRGTNLADEDARPHPSPVKELAPLPGRGAMAGVRFLF